MNVEYQLSGIHFAWDNRKAAMNLRKHNVDFVTACEVFLDPFINILEPILFTARFVRLLLEWPLTGRC